MVAHELESRRTGDREGGREGVGQTELRSGHRRRRSWRDGAREGIDKVIAPLVGSRRGDRIG